MHDSTGAFVQFGRAPFCANHVSFVRSFACSLARSFAVCLSVARFQWTLAARVASVAPSVRTNLTRLSLPRSQASVTCLDRFSGGTQIGGSDEDDSFRSNPMQITADSKLVDTFFAPCTLAKAVGISQMYTTTFADRGAHHNRNTTLSNRQICYVMMQNSMQTLVLLLTHCANTQNSCSSLQTLCYAPSMPMLMIIIRRASFS